MDNSSVVNYIDNAMPYILLTIGTIAIACFGLISKKINLSPLITTYFLALTFTFVPIIGLCYNHCSLKEVFGNILNKRYFYLSIVFFIYTYSLIYAHKILPMTIIGPMLGTLPMFYSFWEYILNGLTINIMQFIGYIIAAIGVLIVNFNGFINDITKKNQKFLSGILGVLAYCLGISYFIVSNDNLKQTTTNNLDFLFQRLFSAGIYTFVMLSIIMWVRGIYKYNDNWPDFNNILKLIGGITFTSLFAVCMFITTKSNIDPVIFAAHGNTRPIFVVLLGIWIMKEKIDRYILTGLLTIITGIIVSIYFTKT